MKNSMLTIAETAHLLSVHINTVRRWSDQGMLKSYRIGTRGDRRFRREDIDSFLEFPCRVGQATRPASGNG